MESIRAIFERQLEADGDREQRAADLRNYAWEVRDRFRDKVRESSWLCQWIGKADEKMAEVDRLNDWIQDHGHFEEPIEEVIAGLAADAEPDAIRALAEGRVIGRDELKARAQRRQTEIDEAQEAARLAARMGEAQELITQLELGDIEEPLLFLDDMEALRGYDSFPRCWRLDSLLKSIQALLTIFLGNRGNARLGEKLLRDSIQAGNVSAIDLLIGAGVNTFGICKKDGIAI